jgi:hypothetical protein
LRPRSAGQANAFTAIAISSFASRIENGKEQMERTYRRLPP